MSKGAKGIREQAEKRDGGQAYIKRQGGDDKKDDEGDGFYLEVKRAWSDGSWSRYYSEAIIADMEYDEVSGRYTVTCPITFDSENMVNYTLTATEAEWANTYGFTDIAEYYAANFAQA